MEPPNPGSARAADVAHRLATPVTAILGYAELIEKSVGDQRNRVRAARIVEQAGRLSELLEELSDPKRAAKEPEAGERSGPG